MPNTGVTGWGTNTPVAPLGGTVVGLISSLNRYLVQFPAHATLAGSVPAVEELHTLHRQPIKGRVDLEGAVDVDLGKHPVHGYLRCHARTAALYEAVLAGHPEWSEHGNHPHAASFLPQFDRARVVSRCPCGCATIDLQVEGFPPPTGGMQLLGDFYFEADGEVSGAFIASTSVPTPMPDTAMPEANPRRRTNQRCTAPIAGT